MRPWLALCLALAAAGAAADDSLIGIWSARSRYDDPPSGILTVSRVGGQWSATIGSTAGRVLATEDGIRISFPERIGNFRGTLEEGGIRGFWIRPAVTNDPRFPGGPSQQFATPTTLRAAGSGTWQGSARPLADRFTLHVKIFKGEDGTLTAAFRDPDQNRRGPASQFRVERDGDTVRFTAGENPAKPDYTLTAKHRTGPGQDPERLQMYWDDVEREIDLLRQTEEQARDFHPRPPGTRYVYAPPTATGDGWDTARASEVGISEAVVTKMIQSIADSDPAARRPLLIHSLLVARQGKLVVEEYFFGHDRDTPHDLRSAGKTFSSVLLGAVNIDPGRAGPDGPASGPDTKVYEVMRERGPFANPDPRKSLMTLEHLMTHTAGFACDDYDEASPGNENTMDTQTAQPDWWKYTLDLPMAHEPGTRYAYCSANINLAGGVLTTVTGTWLPELFRREVAEPLRFGEWHWNLMPNGEGYLGGGARVRPRDLLKIGQVYLDDGLWKDQRIVSADWVRESTAPRVRITPETTGLTPDQFAEAYFEGADALAWHLYSIRAGEQTIDAYAATGNGGQLLFVIPALDITVVFTGGNYMQGGIWNRWADQFIGGHIIPAIHQGEQE